MILFLCVIEVMYFVKDPRKAAAWYATLVGQPISTLDDPQHFFIRVGPQEIWFHLADEKSPTGMGGQVAYWKVESFDSARARAEAYGAELYRGPLDRLDGTFMCQLRDPFGNVFGMIGPT